MANERSVAFSSYLLPKKTFPPLATRRRFPTSLVSEFAAVAASQLCGRSECQTSATENSARYDVLTALWWLDGSAGFRRLWWSISNWKQLECFTQPRYVPNGISFELGECAISTHRFQQYFPSERLQNLGETGSKYRKAATITSVYKALDYCHDLGP